MTIVIGLAGFGWIPDYATRVAPFHDVVLVVPILAHYEDFAAEFLHGDGFRVIYLLQELGISS